MNLRPFDAPSGDAGRLAQFRCSTGPTFEDDVEAWIRNDAMGWANDLPLARFQRRTLAFVEDGGATTAVVAWQDITRVDIDGTWLEVLSVALDHQHSGQGQAAYELTIGGVGGEGKVSALAGAEDQRINRIIGEPVRGELLTDRKR